MNFTPVIGERYLYKGTLRPKLVEICGRKTTNSTLTAEGNSISLRKTVTMCKLSNGDVVDIECLKEIPSTDALDLSTYNDTQFQDALVRLGLPAFRLLKTYNVHYKKAEYGLYKVIAWNSTSSMYTLRSKSKREFLASPMDLIRVRAKQKYGNKI